MKEAAGEANMTIVTIVLIAAVLGIGGFIINKMMSTTSDKSDCVNQGGTWYSGTCCTSPIIGADGTVTGCRSTFTTKH